METDFDEIKAIEKILPPISIKGVRSFHGHASFCQKLIKNVSKIENPLYKLLEKKSKFVFDGDYLKVFECLKQKILVVPLIFALDFSQSFEVTCDMSGVELGVLLG